MIQISAQYGDPQSCDVVRPFHRDANRVFAEVMTRSYFRTLKKLSIVLRVCGKLWSFEGEGPDRLKYLRSNREITVDLIVPQERWRGVSQEQLREYLTTQLRRCFGVLCEHAEKEREVTDPTALAEDFKKAVNILLTK